VTKKDLLSQKPTDGNSGLRKSVGVKPEAMGTYRHGGVEMGPIPVKPTFPGFLPSPKHREKFELIFFSFRYPARYSLRGGGGSGDGGEKK